MNTCSRSIRRRTSILNTGLVVCIMAGVSAGCVSPPLTVPAFPNGSVSLAEANSLEMNRFCIVDGRSCCRADGSTFSPEQLSFRRAGLTQGSLEPGSLDDLARESHTDVPVCILVHGYGFDLNRSVEDARWAISRIQTAAGDQPVRFVLFHWPSELSHTIPWTLLPRDIRRKESQADVAGHYLAWLIDQFPLDQQVCIVGHSLGCRVAACALHLLGGGDAMLTAFSSRHSTDRPINAVFVAAAIDHDWMCPGERYGEAVNVARNILVLTNSKDCCLKWYPILKRPRNASLGYAGVTQEDLKELRPVAERLRVVSVKNEVGVNHRFRNYVNSDRVAELIASTLQSGNGNAGTPQIITVEGSIE